MAKYEVECKVFLTISQNNGKKPDASFLAKAAHETECTLNDLRPVMIEAPPDGAGGVAALRVHFKSLKEVE